MIPNALTACRGFVLRKIAGRLEACRQLVSSAGARLSRPSLLATVGVFMLMLMPVFLALAAVAAALSSPDSMYALAEGAAVVTGTGIRDLKEKRAAALAKARAISDVAEGEKRAMTGEEDSQFTKWMDEVRSLGKTVANREALAEEERSLAENRGARDEDRESADQPVEHRDARATIRAGKEYRSAFARLMCLGKDEITPAEKRALSAGSDTAGGYTIVPEQFATDLIKTLDNFVFLRRLGTKRPVPTAASLGVASLENDPDDFDWTTELQTGSEDSSMNFGKRKMIPHPFAKRIKVSNDFLRMTTTGGESLVRERLAYKAAVTEEKGFMTGSGVARALGIFTASDDGIPTSRDVSTGNTTTAPTFDGLQGAKYALKEQYRKSASIGWIFHPDVLLVLAKIKNGNGDYIWRESVRAGEPDRILNLPFYESQYAPSTLTTGQYVGALGDWSHYWIADALDLTIKRLDELYAETNQVGFIGRVSCDGQFTLPEAAVRVKLA